jgi:hypothetical protein
MRRTALLLALGALFLGLGCDSTPARRDASASSGQRVAEVAVRLDAPSGGVPAASVLAYRAAVTGVALDDVLSVIDPLVAAPPEAGCVRRDVAGAARIIGAHGGKVDLEALGALTVDLGAGSPYLRPLSRVYPDLASAVGGVVGEAGPVDLMVAPQTLGLTDEATGRRLVVAVPVLPRLLDADGVALSASVAFEPGADLVLGVVGPARLVTFVELRPFGATWALACAISARDPGPTGQLESQVVIPAVELDRLADLRVPVSLEAVARETHALTLGGAPTRLTLEVRTSSVVELRP